MGYLRVRFLSKRFIFFNPNHVIISPSLCFLPMTDFNFRIMFYSSVTIADKRHVSPKLSHTNVAALNYLLRSEIFISEDRQLCAIHLILDFQPILEIYQDIGNAIRAGDQRLARIDVSRPSFLARHNLPPIALPLQQVLPEAIAAPNEEIASSCLSLEKEIDKFHFEEEENPGAFIISISNVEDDTDRHTGVHFPTLVIACPDSSSEEEEEELTGTYGCEEQRDNFTRKP